MKQAWQEAAQRGDAEALRAMLKAGEDANSRDRYGQTAIMLAARHGHLEAVRVLIQARADLNHTAKYGLSALMLAVINVHDDVMELLIEAGADTQSRGTGAPGFAGKTAFDLAHDLGRDRIEEFLQGTAELHRDQSA